MKIPVKIRCVLCGLHALACDTRNVTFSAQIHERLQPQHQWRLIQLYKDLRGSRLLTVEHQCSSLMQKKQNGLVECYICKQSNSWKPSLFLSLLTTQRSLLSIEIFIIFSSQILCFFSVKRPANSTSTSSRSPSLLQREVRRQPPGKIPSVCP